MEVIVIIGILVGVGGFIIVSKLANAARILGRISNTLGRIGKQMEDPVIQVVNREPTS
jgi:hypothetical protein